MTSFRDTPNEVIRLCRELVKTITLNLVKSMYVIKTIYGISVIESSSIAMFFIYNEVSLFINGFNTFKDNSVKMIIFVSKLKMSPQMQAQIVSFLGAYQHSNKGCKKCDMYIYIGFRLQYI